MSQTVLAGVVHGKTVELEQESGIPDGQSVKVTLEPIPPGTLPPGEGLRRAFGSWADDPQGLEEYLEWNRQQRKIGRPEIDP